MQSLTSSYMPLNVLDSQTLVSSSTCADPESFVRGGPNLITFFWLMRG